MKKVLLLMMLISCMTASGCACAKKADVVAVPETTAAAETEAESATVEETTAPEREVPEIPGVEIENPWTDCENIDEANHIAGFDFSFPDKIMNDEHERKEILASEGVIDVNYKREDNTTVGIRQEKGENQDVSGDYTEYPETFVVDDCGTTITMCGKDGEVYLTIFSWNGYSYAIYTDGGVTDIDICAIVSELTGVASGKVPETSAAAPVIIDENRHIDGEIVPYVDIHGGYEGDGGESAEITMYTSIDNETLEVGSIQTSNGVSGPLIAIQDNVFQVQDTEFSITIYMENGKVCLDLYNGGKHQTYFSHN